MRFIGLIFLTLILVLTSIIVCNSNEQAESTSYTKTTCKEAKKIIEDNDSVVILDVRTEEEYNEGYIEGAILIPITEIYGKAGEIVQDKSATILVYCRSGNRSARATKHLVNEGYTNVYDIGGILDCEYDLVKD